MENDKEQQIELLTQLKIDLKKDSSSEQYRRVYDKLHSFILKKGYPLENRKPGNFLYVSKKYKNYVAEIIYRLTPKKSKVLEIGFGDARLSYQLAKNKQCSVKSIDVSTIAVGRAKKLEGDLDLEFLWGDARDIKFVNESFDVAISKDVLEHLPSDQHKKYFYEVKRVLKNNGIHLLYLPPKLAQSRCDLHLKVYNTKELNKLLKNEFSSVEQYYVQLAIIKVLKKCSKIFIKLTVVTEKIIEKTKLYKVLGCLNKLIIPRFVYKLRK
ncbi:class I SAM-dependent methyltransferase [Patescibacteria group bacterium]|nr:class I SAM-dependent methyltransferase [Patescibacteria group bacterium]